MFARAPFSEFAREVRQGLTRTDQKTLPCRFLYDSVGSALFDAITYLPEYGPLTPLAAEPAYLRCPYNMEAPSSDVLGSHMLTILWVKRAHKINPL